MPCRLATAETGSRSASRMIATICSSENRPFRIAPSESGASLSTYRWSENLGAGHQRERYPLARPNLPSGEEEIFGNCRTSQYLKAIGGSERLARPRSFVL